MTAPAGLILAAGASRRMPGRSKLSRSWGDTTVIGAVIRAAREAGLAPVLVVVNADDGPPRGSGGCDAIVRAPARGGRAESLCAGLASAPAGPVVVLLGDEPGIRPAVVTRLVDACRAEAADAGRVGYADRPGHPVWLGPAARRAAAAGLTGDEFVWARVVQPPLRSAVVDVEEPAPIDVDSPGALREARRRASADAKAAGAGTSGEPPSGEPLHGDDR